MYEKAVGSVGTCIEVGQIAFAVARWAWDIEEDEPEFHWVRTALADNDLADYTLAAPPFPYTDIQLDDLTYNYIIYSGESSQFSHDRQQKNFLYLLIRVDFC